MTSMLFVLRRGALSIDEDFFLAKEESFFSEEVLLSCIDLIELQHLTPIYDFYLVFL